MKRIFDIPELGIIRVHKYSNKPVDGKDCLGT